MVLPVFLVLCFQDPFYRQIAPNLKRTFDFKPVGRDDAYIYFFSKTDSTAVKVEENSIFTFQT